MAERRYNAVAWELSAVDNVRQLEEIHRWFERDWLFSNIDLYKPYLLNSRAEGVAGKNNNLTIHHGAGPPEAAASAWGRPCWQPCQTLLQDEALIPLKEFDAADDTKVW